VMILIIVMAVVLSSHLIAEQPKENITIVFPLSRGSYWIYKGTAKWTKPTSISTGENKVMEKTLIWKMEVIETINREHLTTAVLKGHPVDLVCYEEGKSRGDYLIIRVGPGKFYLLSDERGEKALKRLRDKKDLLGGLLDRGCEPFLDLPLTPGKVFGETDWITRQDRRYCWVVEGEHQIQLKHTKGISPSRKMRQHRLTYQTLPDHTVIDFVPGVGITRYTYVHHGTIMETDLRLVEYYAGGR